MDSSNINQCRHVQIRDLQHVALSLTSVELRSLSAADWQNLPEGLEHLYQRPLRFRHWLRGREESPCTSDVDLQPMQPAGVGYLRGEEHRDPPTHNKNKLCRRCDVFCAEIYPEYTCCCQSINTIINTPLWVRFHPGCQLCESFENLGVGCA